MRNPGDILLVSCYELGHQPHGTALAAAFLGRAGFAPSQLDLSVERLEDAPVRRARFVGISAPMHTALRLGVRTAERIRAINPGAFLCFYGLYAWLNAEYLLRGTADAVVAGEHEATLVRLAEELERWGEEGGGVRDVPGVSRPGRRSAPVLERLPFLPPSREALPRLERYAHLEAGGRHVLTGYTEASRGCLHGCLHCPIPPVYDGRFFVVPADVVLADIRRQVVDGAAGHITFGDPDFLNGPGHSLHVLRAMHAEFPELTFDFTAKIEHIVKRRGLFPELARLGCLFVVSAVESLSDVVLARLDKGHTRADVHEALAITRAAGITLRPSFVAFTPWTTLDDYLEVLRFVGVEGIVDCVDPVQYSIRLLVPPGSALLDKPWMREHLAGLDETGLTYRWTHPDARMDRLHGHVTRLVEEAARGAEDPGRTYERIYEAARAVAGRQPSRPGSRGRPGRTPAPRLTEPWFC